MAEAKATALSRQPILPSKPWLDLHEGRYVDVSIVYPADKRLRKNYRLLGVATSVPLKEQKCKMHLTKNYWVLKMDFTIFFKEQQKLLRHIDMKTKRYLYQEIDFAHKAICLSVKGE
jgi:hypothetical protein